MGEIELTELQSKREPCKRLLEAAVQAKEEAQVRIHQHQSIKLSQQELRKVSRMYRTLLLKEPAFGVKRTLLEKLRVRVTVDGSQVMLECTLMSKVALSLTGSLSLCTCVRRVDVISAMLGGRKPQRMRLWPKVKVVPYFGTHHHHVGGEGDGEHLGGDAVFGEITIHPAQQASPRARRFAGYRSASGRCGSRRRSIVRLCLSGCVDARPSPPACLRRCLCGILRG